MLFYEQFYGFHALRTVRVWMGRGGYKCQLSVKISVICQLSVKFPAFCQLSAKWLLMINYETYLNIFDAKFGLKGTYNVN